ncbi:glycosyltransferase [Pseudotenacibaculum sp. MALMAid0570]|uniref:glycosyltransferase family 2 protein n=1 Tax=Pseudotenacibaculum sp. MALMAid0570 TaxID=3143938 RepID=UPI0032E03BF8
MIATLFIITGVYMVLILSFVYGFEKLPIFESSNRQSNIHFSIVIPFRDESEHLPNLLISLSCLTYNKNSYECLFVNDDSSDNSVQIINNYLAKTDINYSIIENIRTTNSPKKDAIQTAILQSQHEWIVSTDADCIVPNKWLNELSNFICKNESKMVAGPVTYKSEKSSFLEHFQILDFLSLQGATIGGFGIKKPFLCNGANLAYEKTTFEKLNGFQGNDTISSGDDVFLFEKFYKAYPKAVHFLKSHSAIVHTDAVETWKELINQRMRWAAKTSSYQLAFGKLVGFFVLLMNFVFITSLFGVFLYKENRFFFLYIIILKLSVDYSLTQKVSFFYNGKKKRIRDFGFSSLLYPFFTLYIVFKSLTSKYIWKGRFFKK